MRTRWIERVLELANMELPAVMTEGQARDVRRTLGLHKADNFLPSGGYLVARNVTFSAPDLVQAKGQLVTILNELWLHGPTARVCKLISDVVAEMRDESQEETQEGKRKLIDAVVEFKPVPLVEGPLREADGSFPAMTLDELKGGRRYRLYNHAIMRPATLEQWYAVCLAELISHELGERVRRCELPSCEQFFVNFRRTGPAATYCSPSHASQARVARKRTVDSRKRPRKKK